MSKKTQTPDSVTNLRKIWNKKIKPQYTQMEVAKKLGWTQGAISQYLNNITEMNPAAIIKLANFMEVDPHEIDPNITEHLPNVETITIRHNLNNMSKKLDQKAHYKKKANSFFIEYVTESDKWKGTVLEVCEANDYENASHYIVVKKGEKAGKVYTYCQLPPEETIKKKYAIISMIAGHHRLT